MGFPLDGKRWQSSTNPGSAGASLPSRMLGTLISNSLSLALGGISEISRHYILEYCKFAKYFWSTLISLSDSLESTFSSASSSVNLALSSPKLFIKSSRIKLNSPWLSSNKCTKSSLFTLIKDDSIESIFLSHSQETCSNLYY